MTLDELLKQNTAWLDRTLKQPIFDKADDKTVNFPEEQRQRRIAELRTRIADLSQRKDDMSASYDRAIALEQQELKSLSDQASADPATKTTAAGAVMQTEEPQDQTPATGGGSTKPTNRKTTGNANS